MNAPLEGSLAPRAGATNIIAYDLSSRTGFALYQYNKWNKEEIRYSAVLVYGTKDPLEVRLARFSRDLRAAIKNHLPTAVVYEAAHMRGGPATRSAMGFETVLRMLCHEYSIPAIPVHSLTLKKFATGNGRAEKADMMKAAERLTGAVPQDDNEADAICLAEWGRANVDDKGNVVKPTSKKKKSTTKKGRK